MSTVGNLDSGNSCGLNAAGDITGTNPVLGGAQIFSGTVFFPPQTGSPLIDHGRTASCPAADQRGLPRPQAAACDIGAIEFGRLSQTVTFGALSDRVIGDSPTTLSATATSGLTMTFSSLTPSVCAVNGNVVSFVATGTCTVRAAQAGNSTFDAAASVDRSFTIYKRRLFLPSVLTRPAEQ